MNQTNREVFAHLAVALGRYVPEARRDGLVLPTELLNMAEFFADCATVRQGATGRAGAQDFGDGEDMTQRLMLTKREAASLLACSVRTVDRLIAGGSLPSVKLEGSTRIRRADLEQYVAELSSPRSFRDAVDGKEVS